MKRILILFLVFCLIVPFINADVISLNAGGSKEVVVNPDTYIEGFFSGIQVLSSCGNGLVETPYEGCDDGNYASGDGCSSLCAIESGWTCTGQPSVCTIIVTPSEEGAGGGGFVLGEIYIIVDPMEINRSIQINTNIEENIGITNLNTNSSVNFSVYSSEFDPDLIVNFWDSDNNMWTTSFSLTLSAGEIKELRVRFSAPSEVGLYNGTIHIDGKKVKVNLNVQTEKVLFDSNIIVLNEDYIVPRGDRLRTSITLIPLGDKSRMDVTLNYVIKDYNGRVYLTRSETVLVENQVNFKRNFDTGFLPLGPYIIGLELIYSNGVAPSSAHFEITLGRQNTFFGKVVFFLINVILIILILIILLIILRVIKQIRENRKREEKEKLMEKWKSENNGILKVQDKSEK